MADARPIFRLVNAVSSVFITKVAEPFAPFVIIIGISYTLIAPLTARIRFRLTMVLIFGKMIYRNCCHPFAPSRLAASKSSVLTD